MRRYRVATFKSSGYIHTVSTLAAALEPLGLVPYLDWAIRFNSGEMYLDSPDFVNAEGTVLIEVKTGQGGVRDLRAAAVELALFARDRPNARAVLLVLGARMSAAGLAAEWERLRGGMGVFAPDISRRLGLVALLEEDVVVEPNDPFLHQLAKRAAMAGASPRSRQIDRSFEVMRVLLSRWLLNQGPIAIGELQRQTGLSHPTVSKGLAALGAAVERRSDRSVSLRVLPREVWSQLLALVPKVRQTVAFVDESGRGGDPQGLLRRLERLRPPGVAVAGVVAARHWHPALDLHGLPRLDLSVHAPRGVLDTDFVARLDPALVPAPIGAPPVLVLHGVPRADPLFVVADADRPPWADPVEVLLDLHELRLLEQADALIRHLRRPA